MSAVRPRRTPRPIEERAFHAWLSRRLPSGSQGPLPLGDDAAAVRLPTGTVAVVTTDGLVEGTHFRRSTPPRLVGRAASAVSLSDLAAKGALPLAVFLALVLPPGSPQRWAEELVLAAEMEASRFGAHVLGGDTKPGPVRAVVSTMVGAAGRDRLVGRTGARPGEVLVTTGEVGRGGGAALELDAPGAAGQRAVAGLLRIEPRVREGLALAPFASAMVDTSDGLAEGARLLSAASRVRLVIEERALPLASRVRRIGSTKARREAAFYGGDYELLATVPRAGLRAAVGAVRRAGGSLTSIGTVARGRGAFLATAQGTESMPESAWRPFGRPTS